MDIESVPISGKEWSNVLKSAESVVLRMSIRSPSFSEHRKLVKAERYFNHLILQWKKRWESLLYERACQAADNAEKTGCSFTPWECALDYTITYWDPPLLSIRVEVIENAQSGKPLRIHQGETWDCSTGYPRTLRSFCASSSKPWSKDILRQIKGQAETYLSSGESLLDPNCLQIMERTFDPDRFYLTEKGITIFYPLYLLGPYAEGIPAFTIPFPKLN